MMWTTQPRSRHNGIAYVEIGGGPPVLLLHGVGLRAEAWNAQLNALKKQFRVLVPDMPGHGESDLLPSAKTLANYTDRLVTLIDAPSVIVGHSMGAMIALDMAVRFPHLVTGVVAVNAIFGRSAKASSAVKARAEAISIESPPDPSEPLRRWFGARKTDEKVACREWLKNMDI